MTSVANEHLRQMMSDEVMQEREKFYEFTRGLNKVDLTLLGATFMLVAPGKQFTHVSKYVNVSSWQALLPNMAPPDPACPLSVSGFHQILH